MTENKSNTWAPISCVGKDGVERTFYYKPIKENSPNKYRFFVSKEKELLNELFEISFVDFDNSTIRISMITNHSNKDYRAKGIPAAINEKIAKVLDKTIVSSSNEYPKERYRTEDATKMWERFRNSGNAKYDEKEDRYTFTP